MAGRDLSSELFGSSGRDLSADLFGSDSSDGKIALPADVKPSTSGGGRGSVNPPMALEQQPVRARADADLSTIDAYDRIDAGEYVQGQSANFYRMAGPNRRQKLREEAGEVTPTRGPAAKPETKPRPFKDRREALDDAVNRIEEGYDLSKVVAEFGSIGIKPEEIVQHGQKRGSAYFQQGGVLPSGEQSAPATTISRMSAIEPTALEEYLINPIARGAGAARKNANVAAYEAGIIGADSAAKGIIAGQRTQDKYQPGSEIVRQQEAIQAADKEGAWAGAASLFSNPKAAFASTVESLASSILTSGGTIALGSLAGPVGTAAGAFAGSGASEYSSTILDKMAEKGIPSTAEGIAAALSDKQFMDEARAAAKQRGMIVGSFDAISAGLAGRFIKPVLAAKTAGTLTGRELAKAEIGGSVKELGMQAGFGAGGEAAAQLAESGRITSGSGVALEALAEGFGAPAEVAPNIYHYAKNSPAPSLTSFADPNGPASRAGITPIVVPDVSTPSNTGGLATGAGNGGGSADIPSVGNTGSSAAVGGVTGLGGDATGTMAPTGGGQSVSQASEPTANVNPIKRTSDDGLLSRVPVEQESQEQSAPPSGPKTWSGRNGDGYATVEDASRGLETRKKVMPEFDWKIEQRPDGRYQLGGYTTQANNQADTKASDANATDLADFGAEGYAVAPAATKETIGELREQQSAVESLARAVGASGESGSQNIELVGNSGTAPTPAQLRARRVAEVVGRVAKAAFGIKTAAVTGLNGYGVAHSGYAFVNADDIGAETNTANSMAALAIGTIGHEVGHVGLEKSDDPADRKAYLDLRLAIHEHLQDGVIDRQRADENKAAAKVGAPKVSREYAHNEVIQNINGAMWLDNKFWGRLYDLDPNSMRRIAYRFMQAATKMIKAAKGSDLDINTLVKNVDAVREIVAKTWAEKAMRSGKPPMSRTQINQMLDTNPSEGNAPRVEMLKEGSAKIYGDTKSIAETLRSIGINKFMPSPRDGFVLVSKGDAAKAEMQFKRKGVVGEVAPFPADKDSNSIDKMNEQQLATNIERKITEDRWDDMDGSEKTMANKDVAKRLFESIMRLNELKGWSLSFSTGQYLGKTNPNFIIDAAEDATWEQMRDVASDIGYVLDQQSMVTFDENDTTGRHENGFIKVILPSGFPASKLQELRDLVKEKFPQADSNTQMAPNELVFGNFTKFGDNELSDAEFRAGINGAIEALDWDGDAILAKEPERYASELIWPGSRLGYLKDQEYGKSNLEQARPDKGRPVLRDKKRDRLNELRRIARESLGRREQWLDNSTVGKRVAADRRAEARERVVESGYSAEYGEKSRPGSVQRIGHHYSQVERKTLSSAYYGSGLKGKEKERLDKPENKDIRSRIYFYVDNGTGIHPESGVGGVAHVVKLNNLYDINKDANGYLKLSNGDSSRWERMVMQAGFDGYVADTGANQDFAVLVGKHDVPMFKRKSADKGNKIDIIDDLGAFNLDADYANSTKDDFSFPDLSGAEKKLDAAKMTPEERLRAEMADAEQFRRELEAELRAEGFGVAGSVKTASVKEKSFADVKPADIKAAGFMPETAYPDLTYYDSANGLEKNAYFVVGGQRYRATISNYNGPDIDLNSIARNKKGSTRGIPLRYQLGGLSDEAREAWNKRFAASADLFGRGFDLYTSVPKAARDNILATWKKIAENPDAFEFAKAKDPKGKNYKEVAQDIADQMLKDSKYAMTITETNDPVAGSGSFGFTIKDTKSGVESTGDIEFHPQDKEVTVHVSELEKGSGTGKPVYQVAQAFASAFKSKIEADPQGLLGVNNYRRTEQMFSGALRSGNFDTMQPGVGQRIYGWNERAKTQEQQDRNFVRMALAATRNALEFAPTIKDFGYDLATDKFYVKGKERTPENDLVAGNRIKMMLQNKDARVASISRSTLARAAITLQAIDGKVDVPESIANPVLYKRKQTDTPEFKRWFGAWDVKGSDRVEVVKAGSIGIDHKDTEAIRRWLTSADEFQEAVVNRDSGTTVGFSKGNLKDSLKRRGEFQRAGYSVLRQLIESARFVGYEPSNRDSLKGQDIYYAAMSISGRVYSVKIKADVRHDKTTAYKDHRVNEIDDFADVEVLPAVNKGGTNALGYPSEDGPTQTGNTISLSALLGDDKFEASKVVDADGKPLVVYHSTNAISGEDKLGFSVFDTKSSEMGSHFGTVEQANSFGNGDRRRLMPVYLSIKNPLRITDQGDFDVPNVAWQLVDKGILTEKQAFDFAGKPWNEREKNIKELQDIIKEAGHDGIVYLNRREGAANGDVADANALDEMTDDEVRSTYPEAMDSFIVFDPEQIKSAIGNNGNFDGTNPDIRYKRKQPAAQGLPEETRMQAFQRVMQDQYNRLKLVQDLLVENGGTVGEEQNVYKAEERMHGRVHELLRQFADDAVHPMLKKAVEYKIDLDELALYAYAKHAKERNAHIQGINKQVKTGSGMSDEEADNIIQLVELSEDKAKFEELHQDLMGMTSATRRVLVDEGLITQDEYDGLEKQYENYVPLRGFADQDEKDGKVRPGLGRGFNVKGKETIKAMGRDSKAGDIIENIIRDYERATIRAERNAVGKTFLDLVTTNPDPNLWEVQPVKRAARMSGDQVRYQTVEDKGDDTISVKVAGQQVYIRINDPLLLRAMQNAFKSERSDAEHFIMKGAGMYTSLLRNTITRYNPVFGVINAMRDAQMGAAGVFDELGAEGLKLYAKYYNNALASGWRVEIGKKGNTKLDQYMREMRFAGGTTGGVFMRDNETIQSELRDAMLAAGASPKGVWDWAKHNAGTRGAKHVLKALEIWGATSEHAARLSAYAAAREMGKTPGEAASIAKNLTVNFNRFGEQGQFINTLFLFYNASVQGSVRIAQMMKNPKIRYAMAGAASVGLGLAMMAASVGGDDEDGQPYWDKIPDWEKERNLIVMLPPGSDMGESVGTNGRYFKIPMAYGLNIFPVLGYQIADLIRNAQDPAKGVKPTKAAINMLSAVMGSYNPMGGSLSPTDPIQLGLAVAPTIADPFIQLAAGVDGFGKPTGPSKSPYDQRPDSETVSAQQHGSVYHRISRWVNEATGGNQVRSGAIDIQPGTIKNLGGIVGGGLGKFVADVVNLGYLGATDAPIQTRDIPVVKQLYGEYDPKAGMSLYYDRSKKALDEYKDIKEELKGGIKKDYTDEQKFLYAMGDSAKYIGEAMGELKKQEIQISESGMTAKEKDVARRNLQKVREKYAESFNRIWYEKESELLRKK